MKAHAAFFFAFILMLPPQIGAAQPFGVEFDGHRMKRLVESAKKVDQQIKSDMRDWCRQKMANCRILEAWVPEAGITVPSPWYLRHSPEYFPPSEPYPLPKELQQFEDISK